MREGIEVSHRGGGVVVLDQAVAASVTSPDQHSGFIPAQLSMLEDPILDLHYIPRPSAERLANRVSLEIANLKEATRAIIRYHYLHRGRTMAQLPYWILLDSRRVGVLLFALPRLSVPFCDYGPMNLLELARMYLVPRVQEIMTVDSQGRQHAFAVASCAVGKALRQCRQDWFLRYPHLPDIHAVVSWADTAHHEGVVYRATNFREVGVSGGSFHGNTRRPNGGRDQLNPDYLHVKRAFLYEYRRPLSPTQKARLARRCCASPLGPGDGHRQAHEEHPKDPVQLSFSRVF